MASFTPFGTRQEKIVTMLDEIYLIHFKEGCRGSQTKYPMQLVPIVVIRVSAWAADDSELS